MQKTFYVFSWYIFCRFYLIIIHALVFTKIEKILVTFYNALKFLIFIFSYKGWLLGYQVGFDTAKSKLARSNFAIGYSTDEFTLHTSVLVLFSIV